MTLKINNKEFKLKEIIDDSWGAARFTREYLFENIRPVFVDNENNKRSVGYKVWLNDKNEIMVDCRYSAIIYSKNLNELELIDIVNL